MTISQTNNRIVFLDRGGLPERFTVPRPKVKHDWISYPHTTAEQTINRCRDADIIITNKVKIDAAVLNACRSIKHIAVAATGFNIIDIDVCQRRGISVSNIPSYAANTVSEHVISSALFLRRELVRYRAKVIDGAWQQSEAFCLFDKPFNDLAGATLGIIGFGEIGKAAAVKAHALGMRVIFHSRSQHNCDFAEQVSFDELLTESDIVSLHCSLTPQTTNLISWRELEKMQSHAILINTARGGIANENDVVNAIKDKTIGGIAFDTLEREPPTNDSPLLSIAQSANVILTPHIAWASEQAMQNLIDILSANIEAFLLDKPQNIVFRNLVANLPVSLALIS